MQPDRTDAFVQYGCGLSAPAGWRNSDASATLRAAGFTDIRRSVECRKP